MFEIHADDGRRDTSHGVFFEEELGQGHDVFGALAQRRDDQIDYVQPVVPVFAEGAVGNRLLKVPVSGCHDPHVNFDGFLAANALELVVLEHLEQFGLKPHVHVADLVEQHGAAVGHLEHASLLLEGASERAALVAEELAFDQFGRQRRAIKFEEGFVGAGRLRVQLAGDHLFASAGFALDQDRGLGPTDLTH